MVQEEHRAFLLAMLRMGRPGMVHGRFRVKGLTQGEYFMLDMLSQHRARCPEAKGMYVSELAELLQVSPPAVSRMLRELEQKDFIDRVVDRDDRRITYIVLQPKGEAAHSEMERQALEFAGRVADRLGPEDTAQLIRLWSRLREIMQDEHPRGN